MIGFLRGGERVSKGLKIMLFWSLGFPVIITTFRMIIDYFVSRNIEMVSYSAVFLGTVAAGLIFAGPLHYFISKSNET